MEQECKSNFHSNLYSFSIFFFRKYERTTHTSLLRRESKAKCSAYSPIESILINHKYYWRDIPCDLKAPFICKHNPDFLGFHRFEDVIFDVMIDVEISSMSLTMCLSLCKATLEISEVAFTTGKRCICSKGNVYTYQVSIPVNQQF